MIETKKFDRRFNSWMADVLFSCIVIKIDCLYLKKSK